MEKIHKKWDTDHLIWISFSWECPKIMSNKKIIINDGNTILDFWLKLKSLWITQFLDAPQFSFSFPSKDIKKIFYHQFQFNIASFFHSYFWFLFMRFQKVFTGFMEISCLGRVENGTEPGWVWKWLIRNIGSRKIQLSQDPRNSFFLN
jgi:hypothetical protein